MSRRDLIRVVQEQDQLWAHLRAVWKTMTSEQKRTTLSLALGARQDHSGAVQVLQPFAAWAVVELLRADLEDAGPAN